MVKHSSAAVLLAAICCCVVLVTAEPARVLVKRKPIGRYIEDDDAGDTSGDEGRNFFSGTGASTASAINNLITEKQQQLEALRPVGGTATSTGPSIIVVNAATGTGGSTATTTGGGTGGSNVAGLLIPQVIGAAVSGGNTRRRRRRPGNRRYRGSGRRRPQVYVVRP